jgi:hypothetical protein
MLKMQLPKNRINYLIAEMQSSFDIETLERGWELYHKGRVSGVELLYGLEIHALLRDDRAYDVIVDLESFGKSECSCSEEGFCPHLCAAMFAIYTPFGRPELLLQQVRQALLVKAKMQMARSTTRTDRKQDLIAAPAPNQSAASWHRFFEQQFYGFSVSHQTSIEAFHASAWESLRKHAAGWKEPLGQLYALHVVAFIMRKLEKFYVDSKSSYLSYYHETGCRTAAKQCLEQMLELTPKLDVEALVKQHPAHLKETIGFLRGAVLHMTIGPVDWLTVYRLFWWRLASRINLQELELKVLQAELAKPELTPRKQDTLILCIAHFDVIKGEDAAAVKQLQRLSQRDIRDFFIYFRSFQEHGSWDRMLRWLRWCLPAVARAAQDDFQTLCQYWSEAVKHQSNDEEWVEVMVALLPRTYPYYTAYLLQTSRFKMWVDLQISNRISPASLYAAELKAVEAHDPSFLLPLYTQAVERCITEKNRNSYIMAVKLLKKLQGYYKELGQTDRWEEFIARLSNKYGRLRAFQEELKKGNWIP